VSLIQVWFQNARAKYRRNAVKNNDRQHSPSLASPLSGPHHHHHHDAAAVAAAGGRRSEVQSSAEDVSSASPVSAVSLLDLHRKTINVGGSGVDIGYERERLSSPPPHCPVPALADILCCPSFTL